MILAEKREAAERQKHLDEAQNRPRELTCPVCGRMNASPATKNICSACGHYFGTNKLVQEVCEYCGQPVYLKHLVSGKAHGNGCPVVYKALNIP